MGSAQPDYHPFKSPAAREKYLSFYQRHAADWPVSSETRMAATEDGETFVRVSGPVDAPPVVLLPAGRTPSTCWMPLIESLAANRRTYAFDADEIEHRHKGAGHDAVWVRTDAVRERLMDFVGESRPT